MKQKILWKLRCGKSAGNSSPERDSPHRKDNTVDVIFREESRHFAVLWGVFCSQHLLQAIGYASRHQHLNRKGNCTTCFYSNMNNRGESKSLLAENMAFSILLLTPSLCFSKNNPVCLHSGLGFFCKEEILQALKVTLWTNVLKLNSFSKYLNIQHCHSAKKKQINIAQHN